MKLFFPVKYSFFTQIHHTIFQNIDKYRLETDIKSLRQGYGQSVCAVKDLLSEIDFSSGIKWKINEREIQNTLHA